MTAKHAAMGGCTGQRRGGDERDETEQPGGDQERRRGDRRGAGLDEQILGAVRPARRLPSRRRPLEEGEPDAEQTGSEQQPDDDAHVYRPAPARRLARS
ncbi:hypothetical protein [Georgenia sp. SUBG003]|uniref:hypothetical protein n=1 Tax=Georgenia sp. SUBG003 TaxID=1497974 RepID=UPI003AB27059